jgi:hypothetical protein
VLCTGAGVVYACGAPQLQQKAESVVFSTLHAGQTQYSVDGAASRGTGS